MSAINDLRICADAIERLAFGMPPPNEYTPKFVQLAGFMRRMANSYDAEHKSTITPALDAAIQEEIEHGPKDIMK